jgi:Ser/Thr protein kinase RdoA (MazF antagonist)
VLPLLGPATDDLDRALAFAVDEAILPAAEAAALRGRRDALVRRLLAADAALVPQHGDAFPRNTVVGRDGRVTWIDLEDACLGSRAWDYAVLARSTDDPGVRAAALAAVGHEAFDVATELRVIQAGVWAALHDARLARGW